MQFESSDEKADMFKGLKLHKVGENHTTEGYIVSDENMQVNGTITRLVPKRSAEINFDVFRD